MRIPWKRQACFLLLSLLLLVCGCTGKSDAEAENPGVKITFFDVGKGDAVLVETVEKTMLIDTGYDDTSGVILDYLEQQEISRLDYLVITHFDKDHVGGADRILGVAEAEEILQPDYASDGKQYLEYEEFLKTEGIEPVLVTDTLKFSMDGAEFLVYPPQKQEYEEEDNDFSLVISMTYGERRFFFAGDCERERLTELLEQTEFSLSHDVLKVPHHGKKEKNSEEFFRAVSPKAAIITCSEEQPADDKVRRILRSLGAEVYLTTEGTVTCVSDGTSLKLIQN